jgi:CheY-like chemotaxis protein
LTGYLVSAYPKDMDTQAKQDNKKTILIVEDDQFTRELYQEALSDAGYLITAAVNGVEGLEKAKQGGYDLVLLDIMMPDLDGLSLLARLKEHPPIKNIGAIIMLTNLAHDPVIKQAEELGAKDFLIKSNYSLDQLVDKIKKFLN